MEVVSFSPQYLRPHHSYVLSDRSHHGFSIGFIISDPDHYAFPTVPKQLAHVYANSRSDRALGARVEGAQ